LNDITLFMAPGTCARVTLIALNELGLDFQTSLIRFMKGQHKSPDYLAMNPKGKVPVLKIDGAVLTENVAILHYLNQTRGGLLPATDDPIEQAHQLADLCFCSSTLHPNVTRFRMPQFFVQEGTDVASVKRKASEAMVPNFQVIEDRLAAGDWWYNGSFSAVDGYIYWVYWRVVGAGFDASAFPHYQAHAARMEQRESVKKAIAAEESATQTLKNEGLLFTPPEVKM